MISKYLLTSDMITKYLSDTDLAVVGPVTRTWKEGEGVRKAVMCRQFYSGKAISRSLMSCESHLMVGQFSPTPVLSNYFAQKLQKVLGK